MKRVKLDEIDYDIIRGGASGHSANFNWRFVFRGHDVTRRVKRLKNLGLVSIIVFSRGPSGVNATDAGLELLEQRKANLENLNQQPI